MTAWTIKENRILERAYAEGGYDACVEALPHRTRKAIRCQANTLEIADERSPQNYKGQLIELLEDGAGTSSELAAETGIDHRKCSAVLSRLYGSGILQRKMMAQHSGRPAYLYEITGQ